MTGHGDTKTDSKRGGMGMFVAVIPWVAFSALAEHASLKLGAVAALIAAVFVALPGLRAGKPKMLELGAVVTFIAFVVVAFTADASVSHDVARYARGIAAGALSVLAFASLLFVPFTEQYARESVPAEYWGSQQFKAVNRKLTTMWGLIFAGMIPFHIIAGTVDTTRGNLIFNWAVPGLLVMWGLKQSYGEKDSAPAPVQIAA